MKDILSVKQEKFCVNYFETGKLEESAILAGYSPRSAGTIASETIRKPKIIARIRELYKAVEKKKIMSVQERMEILTEIGRGNLLDYQETGADGSWLNIGKESPNTRAIAEITSKTDENGSVVVKVRLHNPTTAIDLLNKMDKLYSETTQINIDNRKVIFQVGRGYADNNDRV